MQVRLSLSGSLRHSVFALFAACGLALFTSVAAAQQPGISAAAQSPNVSQALEEGRQLESQSRWADALTHYEEALRDNPNDQVLQQRFDEARLHYGIDRRYADASFLRSIHELNAIAAQQLYNDLLLKIDTHYVTAPQWQDLTKRGVTSLEFALLDEDFRQHNAIRVAQPQVDGLCAEMRSSLSRRLVRTRQEAVAAASEIANLASARVGLSGSATMHEFTAAAADGLDNYSAFLTSDQLRDVYAQIEGNFVGLGVELKADNQALAIVDVIPRSPAEQAGLKAGDRIVAVDGKQTTELSTDEAAGMLTGVEGSIVQVTIESPGVPLRTVAVRRAHVEVPSLEDVKIIERQYGVAYVRIPVFQKTTARDLEAALWDLHRQGMRSLIIDLRRNPGGLLTSSVELADKFVADGGIVSTRGRNHAEDFDYRAHRGGTWRVPLVVLIDGDSASASEIFAAAILDNRRGTIVGERSFGKGSVQGIFPLGNNGGGVRLTTASFYSPNGSPISKVGVQPDIVVRRATSDAEGRYETTYRGPQPAEAGERTAAQPDLPQPAVDPQTAGDEALSKAIDVARGQMALRQ
ncbi:MAG: S41 family peptidase [Pirellulales bacterium]